MNGITFVKLQSPYPEDRTKNGALTVSEMDANFATLEGRDIKSITVENDKLTVKLYNGEAISSIIGVSKTENNVSDVIFDQAKGILTLTFADGTIKILEGFATVSNTGTTVAVDGTLVGSGTPANPVGISPVSKTGWYKPVEKIIYSCDNERLPDHCHTQVGTRFLTVEKINRLGFLYDYTALKKIACDLRAVNSPWRIPTKEDWDDMLDAIEPCEEYQMHSVSTPNKYLGMFAGKYLKSVDGWKSIKHHNHPHNICGLNDEPFTVVDDCCDHCKKEHHSCVTPPTCGDHWHHHHPEPPKDFTGLDKYGFCVEPAGYADDGGNFVYFKERAAFWTATNSQFSTAYTKRFEYNHNDVHQDILAAQNHLSIRLVKDYNGGNYNEREDILGHSYSTVLMPSMKSGKKVWTSVNVAFADKCYDPMIPNDGQGLIFTKQFYINEWNGKEWLRNELREGESVVVKHPHNGAKDVEYRLIQGELVNIPKSLIKTVSDGFKPLIDRLNDKIEGEINRSTSADEAHDELIKNLQEGLDNLSEVPTEIENIKSSIETINEEIKSIEEKHSNDVEEINQTINDRVDTLNGKIDETSETLNKKVDEVNQELNEKVDEVNQKLNEKVDEVNESVNQKIDSAVESLNAKIEESEANQSEKVNGVYNELYRKVDEINEKIDVTGHNLNIKIDSVNETLNKKVDTVNEELNNKIDSNQSSVIERLEVTEGNMPTSEGTEFDAEKGKLTIKSNKGTNDIEVQFSFNFGTF